MAPFVCALGTMNLAATPTSTLPEPLWMLLTLVYEWLTP